MFRNILYKKPWALFSQQKSSFNIKEYKYHQQHCNTLTINNIMSCAQMSYDNILDKNVVFLFTKHKINSLNYSCDDFTVLVNMQYRLSILKLSRITIGSIPIHRTRLVVLNLVVVLDSKFVNLSIGHLIYHYGFWKMIKKLYAYKVF